jgi:hypothetical protein
MLDGFLKFFSPEPETGTTPAARSLHIGSKLAALAGIFTLLIGIAMIAMTFASEDRIKTTGTITEIIDLPDSDLQRVTIDYMIDQTKYSKSETTSGFREFNHKVGDQVELLVSESDVILVVAIPTFRKSFIKTSLIGVVLILASVLMRKMSRNN